MTYQEAKRAVFRRKYVRRSSWPEDRVLHKERTGSPDTGREGWMIADHRLHPMGGSTAGDYTPVPEDEAASDWDIFWEYSSDGHNPICKHPYFEDESVG